MSDSDCVEVPNDEAWPKKPLGQIIRDECPAGVLLAVHFVEMTLDQFHEHRQESVLMDTEDGIESHAIEMPSKQQAAFDLACNLIGTYFVAEAARIKGE